MKKRSRKHPAMEEEVERRLQEINGEGVGPFGLGLFEVMARRRVIVQQAAEREERIKAECKLVRRDVRRSILAQMGEISASDSDT